MKIKFIKKRIIIDASLLVVTFVLAIVTGQDVAPEQRQTPKITPHYLLSSNTAPTSIGIFDYYNIGDNEYAVALNDNYTSGDITVPSVYPETEYKVTGIWHNAFHNCAATSITLTDNIKTIDFEAFLYSGIITISIPYSVSAIGDAAFYSCNSLTTVDFVNSNEKAAGEACSCDEPEQQQQEEEDDGNVIYSSLTQIPSYCFFKCQALTSVTFPSSLQEIGEEAFNGCAAIESPLFFQNLNTIRSRAFQGCIGLTSVYIPSSMFANANGAGIEPHAFNYCDTSLEFTFCGDDSAINTWITNHPNWGWRIDGNPSSINGRYSITKREHGDTFFTTEWSYSVDENNNITLKSYNGATPSQAKGYLISVPDTLPTKLGTGKVVRIDVGVFNDTVKAALRRLYLPSTLQAIENKMFATGYTNLFIIDVNTDCATDGGWNNNNYPGRIDLSGLTDLEFIGVHAFARSGSGLGQKNRIKSIHLPANLRSIGDEAFGVFQERMFPKVEEFIWDYDESTSRLETIGADCFYGVGLEGSGQIKGNSNWKNHSSSIIVFPKTFKYFGILEADETAYRNQANNPFNFQLYNGEKEKANKWERPAHAFAGCSLISTVIFKGGSGSEDLLIPVETFVFNESLHTIIFEERNGKYITFHTQQGNFDYSQECIGGNSGKGGNDFRREPFLQTIILPNQNTTIRVQKFAFHANSRAAMYFSGSEGTKIVSDAKDGVWKNLNFDNKATTDGDPTLSRAPQWNMIGDESHTASGKGDQSGYHGFCFAPTAETKTVSNADTLNTFSISQQIPTYYNVHFQKTYKLNNGEVNVEVGGGEGCKELLLDNEIIKAGSYKCPDCGMEVEQSTTTCPHCGDEITPQAINAISYPSYCAYVCEKDTTRDSNDQYVATMSKYLYDLRESDKESADRRTSALKITARVKSSVSIDGKTYKVVKVGDSAFSACFADGQDTSTKQNPGTFDDLKYVELPDSIEKIGEYAFIRCYGIEKISAYTSGNAAATDYEMPAKLRHIGKNAFLFSSIKEIRKIHKDCRFYENENETFKITSVFANCLSLRVITFTTTDTRDANEVTYTDYYETTTYTSATDSKTYTSALYSTNDAAVAYNKNKLLVVLNRDAADVNKASVDHLSNAECTVSGAGVKFDGLFRTEPFLFGAYKMGYWIKELKCGNPTVDGSGNKYAQPLFSAIGQRSNKELTYKEFKLYTNAISYENIACDVDTIDGNVLNLPKYGLKGCEQLKTVYLPNAVNPGDPKTIPDGLFSEATSADFITDGPEGSNVGVLDLSNTGYTSIGQEAFKGNTKITKFIAPNVSTFTINSSAFSSCSNLTTIDLSNVTGTLDIKSNAFASTKLNGTTITWPSSPCKVKIEGSGAFNNCKSMTTISLPTNMTTTLGSNTFKDCTNLTTVTTVGGGASPITTIGSSAFQNCSSLTNFDFAKFTSLVTINESAFHSAGSLSATTVLLPATLKTVGKNAFNSSGITSVTFQSNTSITLGETSFQSCTSLVSVIFTETGISWGSYNKGVFKGCTNLEELQLPTNYNLKNNSYSATGDSFFIESCGKVNIFTYTVYNNTTATSNWRKIIANGAERDLYFYLTADAITELTTGNVIDGSGVNNDTTLFWTRDANGHAIILGTVSAYDGTTVTFSSGYTFDTTNGFVSH